MVFCLTVLDATRSPVGIFLIVLIGDSLVNLLAGAFLTAASTS